MDILSGGILTSNASNILGTVANDGSLTFTGGENNNQITVKSQVQVQRILQVMMSKTKAQSLKPYLLQAEVTSITHRAQSAVMSQTRVY